MIGKQDETNKLRIAEFTVLDHLWFDDVTGIRFDDVTRIHPGKRLRQVRQFRHVKR